MSPKLPSATPRKVIKALKKMGYVFHHQKGSHVFLFNPAVPGRLVNVPYHNRDLKKGTLKIILKQVSQTGMEPNRLIELL